MFILTQLIGEEEVCVTLGNFVWESIYCKKFAIHNVIRFQCLYNNYYTSTNVYTHTAHLKHVDYKTAKKMGTSLCRVHWPCGIKYNYTQTGGLHHDKQVSSIYTNGWVAP